MRNRLRSIKVFFITRIPTLKWAVYEKNKEVRIILFRYRRGRIGWSREFVVKKVCTEISIHTTKMDRIICDRLDKAVNSCNDSHYKEEADYHQQQ